MREKIRALYYPDFWVNPQTLYKSILLFDELHFMDRPSMMLRTKNGQVGTIGAASPLRQFEASFRAEGIPFYVHNAGGGSLEGERYDQIKADIDQPDFLSRYQNGLKTSKAFCNLQIPQGNYGPAGNQDDVAKALSSVDYQAILQRVEAAHTLLEDDTIKPFDTSEASGQAKQLITGAMFCSAKTNFALGIAASEGFHPLADAAPYGDLLGAKHIRAVSAFQPAAKQVQITDVSFAIFDELISSERLQQLDIKTVVAYRKASEKAREQFLEHLAAIQAKQSTIGADGDYQGALEKIIATEIRPAVTAFRNQLTTIDEKLSGSIAKGAVGALGGSSALNIFGNLSLPQTLLLVGTAAAYVA
ncbi:MAG: hypothetical protein JO253_01965, partial [Alphaproteobacteria bacterium]|nr:hypothetical protein [Alphaproteobacteria bacterium]